MTTENNLLSLSEFKSLVKNAPLFSMDFVVLSADKQVLVGKRRNAPAKGYWFVPGGRVFKNELLNAAFKRISTSELGLEIPQAQAQFLGLYDHLYDDSFSSESVSTHYINAAYCVFLEVEALNLPSEQHDNYRWVTLNELIFDDTIHPYSKVFLPDLTSWIQQERFKD